MKQIVKQFVQKNAVLVSGCLSALVLVLQQAIPALHQGETSLKAIAYAALLAVIGVFANQRKGKGFTLTGILMTVAGVFHNNATSGVFTWNEFLLSAALAIVLAAMESFGSLTNTPPAPPASQSFPHLKSNTP